MNDTSRKTPGEYARRIGLIAWSMLGVLLFLGAVIWLLTKVDVLLGPLVLAGALLYILNPIVTRLHRHGVPRLLGSCLSYLVLIGILVIAGFLLVPGIVDQGRDLGANMPELYEEVTSQVEEWADAVGFSDLDIPTYDEVRDYLADPEHQEEIVSEAIVRLGDITLTILEAILVFLIAPVIAFYLLIDLPRRREDVIGLMPPRFRDEILHVAGQLGTAIGGFLRGQVLVAIIVGILTSVGFAIIGLPFFLVIGMIAGLLNIIPFVGPWVGGALGVTVALVFEDPQTAVWAAVVAAAVQQIDNHFISPTVLRATVRLHPATIILALLAGGAIGGLWGVLLAVPTVAMVKIIVGHLWRTRILGQSWEEVEEALIEEHDTTETFITRLRRTAEVPVVNLPEQEGGPGGGDEDTPPPE